MEISRVTTKGQVTIPAGIRTKLGIKPGARIRVEVDEETNHIILTPIIRKAIYKYLGILNRRPREKPMTQLLLEERARDLQREEAKFSKHRSNPQR